MNRSEPPAVMSVLRAVADARNGPFYDLWVALCAEPRRPPPTIDLRVYPVADRPDAYLVVSVTGQRDDGREVCWSVGVIAGPESLEVVGSVELGDGAGNVHEVFQSAVTAVDAAEAATAVTDLAADVTAQRQWCVDRSGPPDARSETPPDEDGPCAD